MAPRDALPLKADSAPAMLDAGTMEEYDGEEGSDMSMEKMIYMAKLYVHVADDPRYA